MYAIMGITGRVGGAAADALLEQGEAVRAVVRDSAKAEAWAARGAEVAVADSQDTAALRAAFTGVDGVFVMIPPDFAPDADFTETREIIAAIREALAGAAPPKIVVLSSVGAQQPHGLGLITQTRILEEALDTLPLPRAFLRPAWFLENALWDVGPARETGEVPSFLVPTDRAIPMVATADIGRVAAETLRQTWTGRRVIEIAGPRAVSSDDIAATLAEVLGRPVRAVPVPREQWAAAFEAQGMPPDRTAPRIEMLDGFNAGWIDFEANGSTEHVTGNVPLTNVLRQA